MKLTCPDCDTVYNIPKERIGKKVKRASCRLCGASIPLNAQQLEALELLRDTEVSDGAEMTIHPEDRTVISDLPELGEYNATPVMGLASRPGVPSASRVGPLTIAAEVALWDLGSVLTAGAGQSVSRDDACEVPLLQGPGLEVPLVGARAPWAARPAAKAHLATAAAVLSTAGAVLSTATVPTAGHPESETATEHPKSVPDRLFAGMWRSPLARGAFMRVKRPSRIPALRQELPPVLAEVIQLAELRRRMVGRAMTAAFFVASVLLIVNCT